jgi:TolB-like protein/Flp pilus assembly protein TadD
MAADDEAIGDLAQAVLDGDPIDWAAAESNSHITSGLIRQLKVVDTLAREQREDSMRARGPDEDRRRTPVGAWGHLHLVECIGRGAFGEVYRAWDARLERHVALKLVPVDAPGGEAGTMLREGRLLARLRHPNVVTIHGADLRGARVGLWMELVRGSTLDALMGAGATFPPREVARIGRDLARALQAVHGAGLLHRDVKAQNVMRDDEGRIVLMDFGTGRRLDEQENAVAGTPLYLAPEVFQGQPATAQSDVYSLGVLLFHLLTRSFPVRGATLQDLRRAHEQGRRADLRALAPDVPPALARIVERAIDPRPESRYPDVEAMAADLEAAAAPPRRRWPWIGGLAAATLMLTVLVWFAPERPVVGVLPFDVRGSDAGEVMLAEGLAIDLSQRLAQLERLEVRPAGSPPPPEGTPHDVQAVGRQLGANHLLLGSVIGEAGSIRRIEASLVRVADRQTLWAGSFVPRNNDLFAAREQIALAVAGKLGLRFARGRRTHQTEPGLQRLFYNARALLARRDSRSRDGAVTLLEQIHGLDPSYVPAATALARALLTVAADRDVEPPLDPRVERLAVEAHAEDTLWPDANAARGLLCAHRHDWVCARRFFEAAIRLDPGMTENHVDFVLSTLLPLGRLAEALRVLERARIEDPMSLDVKRSLALLQIENGLYDEAIATSRAIMPEDPDLRYVDQWVGRALYLSGRSQEALELFTQEHLHGRLWMYRAYVLAVLGRHEEARALLAQHPRAQHAGDMLVYSGLGDREQAFDALRKAAALDPWRAVTWMQRREMALLRNDPRYDELRTHLLQRR